MAIAAILDETKIACTTRLSLLRVHAVSEKSRPAAFALVMDEGGPAACKLETILLAPVNPCGCRIR